MKMEDYLYKKYLYLWLSRKEKKLTSMTYEEWEILDRKVLWTIWLYLEALVAFKISKEMETKSLMKAFFNLYEKPLASKNVFLMNFLFNMMLKGWSIADHLNKFNTVTCQLSFIGVNIDDEVRALLFLCSFLESWNDSVMVISNFVSGSSTLKFEDVVGSILSEEMPWKI